jgi:hypothetical protein
MGSCQPLFGRLLEENPDNKSHGSADKPPDHAAGPEAEFVGKPAFFETLGFADEYVAVKAVGEVVSIRAVADMGHAGFPS